MDILEHQVSPKKQYVTLPNPKSLIAAPLMVILFSSFSALSPLKMVIKPYSDIAEFESAIQKRPPKGPKILSQRYIVLSENPSPIF